MNQNIALTGNLRATLCKLFLYCAFTRPELIKGQIIKHFEIPEESIKIKCEKRHTDDNGNEISRFFSLFLLDTEFVLRYDKKTEPPKEIEVQKVVKKPKKWWQYKPNTIVTVEKVASNEIPKTYWVLNAIIDG